MAHLCSISPSKHPSLSSPTGPAGSSSWMHLSWLFTLAVRDRSWKGARPRSHRVHQCRRLVAAWPHALLR
eukprot:2450995-Prymnesium_polylepis.1